MRLLLVKERLFLFGEFAVSKSQYLYNNMDISNAMCVLHTSRLRFERKHEGIGTVTILCYYSVDQLLTQLKSITTATCAHAIHVT